MPRSGQRRGDGLDASPQLLQREFYALIALRHLGLVKVVQGHGLSELEYVLGLIVTTQCLADRLGKALQRMSRGCARTSVLRSPATMARMIFMPVRYRS